MWSDSCREKGGNERGNQLTQKNLPQIKKMSTDYITRAVSRIPKRIKGGVFTKRKK